MIQSPPQLTGVCGHCRPRDRSVSIVGGHCKHTRSCRASAIAAEASAAVVEAVCVVVAPVTTMADASFGAAIVVSAVAPEAAPPVAWRVAPESRRRAMRVWLWIVWHACRMVVVAS